MSKPSKHLRDCPAAGRPITSRDCGEGRHSQFHCPAECPYNPFSPANYDEFGVIEERFTVKALDFFVRENRGDSALMRDYAAAMERGIGDATDFGLWQCFWRRDANGLTLADRWEKRRLDGLGNDERTVFAGHRQVRPALIEIRRVIDEKLVECEDLFTGERFTVADRALASEAARFDAMLAWLSPQPHFRRFLGEALRLPEVGALEPKQILVDTARHVGAPEEPEALTRWLAEHVPGIKRALQEISKALRHAMFAGLDAKFHYTDYRLSVSPLILREKVIQSREVIAEELSPEEQGEGFVEGFAWLEPQIQEGSTQPKYALPGHPVIGRVLLGHRAVRLEANSTADNAQLRLAFERVAGNLAVFRAEKVEDLAARLASEGPKYDEALVPRHFLDHAPRIELATSRVEDSGMEVEDANNERMRQFREGWVDRRLPALDERTPREAAGIASLRKTLIRIVKNMVKQADNESVGSSAGATQLIATLGLAEIAEPTPPERPWMYERDDEA